MAQLYSELLKQTQSLMPAQTNPMQRLLLMRARPKVRARMGGVAGLASLVGWLVGSLVRSFVFSLFDLFTRILLVSLLLYATAV